MISSIPSHPSLLLFYGRIFSSFSTFTISISSAIYILDSLYTTFFPFLVFSAFPGFISTLSVLHISPSMSTCLPVSPYGYTLLSHIPVIYLLSYLCYVGYPPKYLMQPATLRF